MQLDSTPQFNQHQQITKGSHPSIASNETRMVQPPLAQVNETLQEVS